MYIQFGKTNQQYNKKDSKDSKDIYNEIHSKIDILNISIDSKNDNKADYKKYKFIKPKNK